MTLPGCIRGVEASLTLDNDAQSTEGVRESLVRIYGSVETSVNKIIPRKL